MKYALLALALPLIGKMAKKKAFVVSHLVSFVFGVIDSFFFLSIYLEKEKTVSLYGLSHINYTDSQLALGHILYSVLYILFLSNIVFLSSRIIRFFVLFTLKDGGAWKR